MPYLAYMANIPAIQVCKTRTDRPDRECTVAPQLGGRRIRSTWVVLALSASPPYLKSTTVRYTKYVEFQGLIKKTQSLSILGGRSQLLPAGQGRAGQPARCGCFHPSHPPTSDGTASMVQRFNCPPVHVSSRRLVAFNASSGLPSLLRCSLFHPIIRLPPSSATSRTISNRERLHPIPHETVALVKDLALLGVRVSFPSGSSANRRHISYRTATPDTRSRWARRC